MKALTAKLLAGSGVSEATHPGLVSLLELAAAGPGIPKGSALDTPALRKRLLRDWKRVCEAFWACLAAGVSDSDVLGVRVPPDELSPAPFGYRVNTARALETALKSKGGGMRSFPVSSFSDLREAREGNGLPPLTGPLDAVGVVETPLDGARGFVMSWLIHGLPVKCALVADECGRVRAVGVSGTKSGALAFLSPPVS